MRETSTHQNLCKLTFHSLMILQGYKMYLHVDMSGMAFHSLMILQRYKTAKI